MTSIPLLSSCHIIHMLKKKEKPDCVVIFFYNPTHRTLQLQALQPHPAMHQGPWRKVSATGGTTMISLWRDHQIDASRISLICRICLKKYWEAFHQHEISREYTLILLLRTHLNHVIHVILSEFWTYRPLIGQFLTPGFPFRWSELEFVTFYRPNGKLRHSIHLWELPKVKSPGLKGFTPNQEPPILQTRLCCWPTP